MVVVWEVVEGCVLGWRKGVCWGGVGVVEGCMLGCLLGWWKGVCWGCVGVVEGCVLGLCWVVEGWWRVCVGVVEGCVLGWCWRGM